MRPACAGRGRTRLFIRCRFSREYSAILAARAATGNRPRTAPSLTSPPLSSTGNIMSEATHIKTISIIGGTGALGSGLARRWARAGLRISYRLAQGRARGGRSHEPRAAWRGGYRRGLDNRAAAAAGDMVVLTVPFAHQRPTLDRHPRPTGRQDPGRYHRAAGAAQGGPGAAAGRRRRRADCAANRRRSSDGGLGFPERGSRFAGVRPGPGLRRAGDR